MSFVLKLSIHATPGAKTTQAAGLYGNALRVRLAAAPVDGKANTALIAWAAKLFAVPKKQVQLLHGAAGRQKTLQIVFDSAPALAAAQSLLDQLTHSSPTPETTT